VEEEETRKVNPLLRHVLVLIHPMNSDTGGGDLKTSKGISDEDGLRPVAITQPVGEMVVCFLDDVYFL